MFVVVCMFGDAQNGSSGCGPLQPAAMSANHIRRVRICCRPRFESDLVCDAEVKCRTWFDSSTCIHLVLHVLALQQNNAKSLYSMAPAGCVVPAVICTLEKQVPKQWVLPYLAFQSKTVLRGGECLELPDNKNICELKNKDFVKCFWMPGKKKTWKKGSSPTIVNRVSHRCRCIYMHRYYGTDVVGERCRIFYDFDKQSWGWRCCPWGWHKLLHYCTISLLAPEHMQPSLEKHRYQPSGFACAAHPCLHFWILSTRIHFMQPIGLGVQFA